MSPNVFILLLWVFVKQELSNRRVFVGITGEESMDVIPTSGPALSEFHARDAIRTDDAERPASTNNSKCPAASNSETQSPDGKPASPHPKLLLGQTSRWYRLPHLYILLDL